MESLLLIRYGEIHLKGLNRPFFERRLVENIQKALSGMGVEVRREQGRFYVWGLREADMEEALERLKRVFGIHSISPACAVEKDWAKICAAAASLMEAQLAKRPEGASFKVFARRSDKHFPMRSDEIGRELGHELLERFEGLRVDVHEPQIRFCVEVREHAYLYTEEIEGAGGMPTGTAGRSALLLSGGIDSPVAGYMMARRGLELSAVHFYSYPYTSPRARDKVVELARLLSRYAPGLRLHLVPFTDIQLAIYDRCPAKETTVLMRRLMMRIAEILAERDGARALITGESLGQVASQTLESLCATDDAVSMPVFRPLIGFDKNDVVKLARKIGSFETSILPYEDCCTVFVPQHPVTKPDVEQIRRSEARVDFTEMIEKSLLETETMENF